MIIAWKLAKSELSAIIVNLEYILSAAACIDTVLLGFFFLKWMNLREKTKKNKQTPKLLMVWIFLSTVQSQDKNEQDNIQDNK